MIGLMIFVGIFIISIYAMMYDYSLGMLSEFDLFLCAVAFFLQLIFIFWCINQYRMTRKIGNFVIIEDEPPDECELCGKNMEN